VYVKQNIAQFCIMATYHYAIKRPRISLTSVISLSIYFVTHYLIKAHFENSYWI